MLASVRFRLKLRHIFTLLLLSTALLIQNAQSMPLSSQSLKAPESTNGSNLTGSLFTGSTTSNESNWHAWHEHIRRTAAPQAGCFHVTYPSTVWNQTQCVSAPLRPLLPSLPSTVGNGNDEVAQSPGTLIGSSFGSFQSISGLTSETDSMFGANLFTLQDNANTFLTSTTYTGSRQTTGWEQFVYENDGFVYIQYWLINYQSTYGSCPSTGLGLWAEAPGCHIQGAVMLIVLVIVLHPRQPQTSLI